MAASSIAAEALQQKLKVLSGALSGARRNVPMDIVVVDDSTVIHRMMARRFKMLSWNITSVYNGKEAIALYEKTGFKGIDLVLMDKEMPVMAGDIATEKLIKMGCSTPIVALTSCTDSLDGFLMRGAMGALSKPLQIPDLIQTLVQTKSMQTPAIVTCNPNIESWTPEEVCHWLSSLGNAYKVYASAFRYHGITGKTLLLMDSPEHFETLGVTSDVHRKRLQTDIHGLLRECMSKFRDQTGDKTAKDPLVVKSGHRIIELNDQDSAVENLYIRCTGHKFSDTISDIFSKSLPHLTKDAKQKIRMWLSAQDEDKSSE